MDLHFISLHFISPHLTCPAPEHSDEVKRGLMQCICSHAGEVMRSVGAKPSKIFDIAFRLTKKALFIRNFRQFYAHIRLATPPAAA